MELFFFHFVSRFWLVIMYWIVNIFALFYIWLTLNKLNSNNTNNKNNNNNNFYLHWLIAKKACEATKEQKDVVSNWSHLNLRHHNFGFHLSNTVDLFNVVTACALVVPVVVAVGKDIQE